MSWSIPSAAVSPAKSLQDPRAIALANEGQQVQQACKAIEAMTIVDQNDLDSLGAGMKEAKGRVSELERQRRGLTDPLMTEVENYREWFRPVERAYEALLKAMKARTARHYEETARAQQAAQQAAGQAFQQGDQAKAFQTLAAAPLPAHTEGVGVRYAWTAEVINAGLVPREFCEPSTSLINATFKPGQENEPTPIAGVKFTRKPIVAVRG